MIEDNYSDETWNMAKAYFIRVDALLTLCTKAQMNGDGHKWYQAIIGLYKEIYPKMKETAKEDEKTMAKKLKTKLDVEYNRYMLGHKIKIEAYLNFELYLRELMEKKKMITPKGDDPSNAYRGY